MTWIIFFVFCEQKDVLSLIFCGHTTNVFVFFVDWRHYDLTWFRKKLLPVVAQNALCIRNEVCYTCHSIQFMLCLLLSLSCVITLMCISFSFRPVLSFPFWPACSPLLDLPYHYSTSPPGLLQADGPPFLTWVLFKVSRCYKRRFLDVPIKCLLLRLFNGPGLYERRWHNAHDCCYFVKTWTFNRPE